MVLGYCGRLWVYCPVQILKIRSQAEEVKLAPDALDYLRDVAQERKSIRYAIQLMTPAKLLAQAGGRAEISVGVSNTTCACSLLIWWRFQKLEVQQCEELFIDARTSARLYGGEDGSSASNNGNGTEAVVETNFDEAMES
jgi:TIP49 AAA-lid domain